MHSKFVIALVILCGAAGVAISCSRSSEPTPAAAPTPPPMKTWGGDLTAVVSVKELMRDLIDPIADNIFDSVGSRVTKQGIEDWEPKTQEQWDKVRIGAVAMAEASYLLKIPRPIEPPGAEKKSQAPDAPELPPDQILAKLQRDPVLWQAKIEALRNVGKEVLEIVEKRDAAALLQANEDLDNACEQCHLEFWYPSQKLLFEKLRREDLQQKK